ncbi:MAG: universal stress protein [Deltaproteobacteria bacterium]|nr:universal stress protein [Deltaproteobacteria bacterium]
MIPQIKKILYATDLSKNSSYAFLYAVDLAKKHNAKIVILHAIEPIPAYAEAYGGLTGIQKKQQIGEMVESMKNHLAGFCKKAEAQIGPPCAELVSKILVLTAYPPDAILNTAEQEGCDVIILGTHGKGFISYAFLGSVSKSILHRTQKPVFVIPLPSDKTAVDWDGI